MGVTSYPMPKTLPMMLILERGALVVGMVDGDNVRSRDRLLVGDGERGMSLALPWCSGLIMRGTCGAGRRDDVWT